MQKKYKKNLPVLREIDRQLHKACRELSPLKMKEAILLGADVNAPDCEQREAPIDMVVNSVIIEDREHYFDNVKKQERVREAIDLLLKHGASPDGYTMNDTPLYWFAWLYFEPYIVRRLCRAGATLNTLRDGRDTLYDLTVSEGFFLETGCKECPRQAECLQKNYKIQETLRYCGAKSSLELKEEAEAQHGPSSD